MAQGVSPLLHYEGDEAEGSTNRPGDLAIAVKLFLLLPLVLVVAQRGGFLLAEPRQRRV